MKKSTTLLQIFIVSICLTLQLSAQNVSISTALSQTAHPSALLDLIATDKGVSIPNVSLIARNLPAPLLPPIKPGLLVFNTATVNGFTPGFYFWYNSQGSLCYQTCLP